MLLVDYNSPRETESPVENDFWRTLLTQHPEAARQGLLTFSPPDVRKERRASAPAGEMSASECLSVEAEDRQENELRALMIAGLDGDRAAYHTLLERLAGHLRAYYRHRFARIGHGPTEAEDLLQEALIALHTQRHSYDRTRLFTPWLHAIARYKFLDYLRRTRASFKDVSTDSVEEITGRSDLAAVESGLDLERLMSKISAKAREIIQFVKLDGLSVQEAARRCGMSESAVKVTVHRGLRALALQIRKESQA